MSSISYLEISAILLNFLTICTYGDPGNLRSIEMQTYPMENERQIASFPNTIYYPNMYSVPYEQSSLMQAKSAPRMESRESKSSPTFNDFIDAVNEITDHNDEYPQSRAASKFASPITFNKPLKYTYEKPNYVPWSPNLYQDVPSVLAPSVVQTDKLWKPRFGLLDSGLSTPSKWGSLLNFVFALLGGSDLKGLKDTFIHSILKPLLVSKSGLKALLSKLAIPVVALVLVNVEILVVVWWLWEECPEVQPIETTTPFSQTTFSNFSASK